uniref:Variant surface glycoprotein n=1 Tax=Trypanosoma brucei TaxID=5691 RepID=A0A1V0FZ81_9TRYP|nr:variant surface glycoprotein [Trypanosoma brucei]
MKEVTALQLVVGLAVLLTNVVQRTESATADNVAEYLVVCELKRLVDAAATIPDGATAADIATPLEDINLLNLSTATGSWYNDKDGKLKKSDGNIDEALKTEWENLKKKITEATDTTGKKIYKRLPVQEWQLTANKKLDRISRAAEAVKIKHSAAVEAAKTAFKETKGHLTNALYGKGHKAFDKAPLKTSLTNNCGHANVGGDYGGLGQALAYDAICICSTSDASGKTCGTDASTASLSDLQSGDSAKQAWEKVATACPQLKPLQQLTPQQIRGAVSKFAAILGRGEPSGTTASHKNIFGKAANAGTCDMANAGNSCVKYTGILDGRTKQIPRIEEFEDAATKLELGYAKQNEIKSYEHHIQILQEQAWQQYIGAEEELELRAKKIINQLPKTDPKQKQEEDKAKCNNIDKEAECTATQKCKWNAEAKDPKKKCTLSEEAKKEAEKANQETEGNDGKTSIDCKDKQKKD